MARVKVAVFLQKHLTIIAIIKVATNTAFVTIIAAFAVVTVVRQYKECNGPF